jgi:hypothetical protein
LEEIVAAPGLENRNYGRRVLHDTPISAKVGASFADKRQFESHPGKLAILAKDFLALS